MALQAPPGGVDVLLSHEAPAGIPVLAMRCERFRRGEGGGLLLRPTGAAPRGPRRRNSDVGVARPLIIPALSKRPWSRSPSEVARLAAAHRSAAPEQPSPSSVRSVPEVVMSRNPGRPVRPRYPVAFQVDPVTMAIDGERSITEAVPCSYSMSPQVVGSSDFTR